MKHNRKVLSALALFAVVHASQAVPFAIDGRSLGMGGVSVATADLATAAWANPAKLTDQRPDDDFALLIGFGAFIGDHDDLLTDIDDFQAADDRREAALNASNAPGALTAAQDMANIISGIDGKSITGEVSGVMAVGIAFEEFAMAISVRSDAMAAGTVTETSQNAVEVIDPTKNILNLEGVIATEFGLSLAKEFELLERKVSIGIKPKIVDLQTFSYRESLRTIDGADSITNRDNKTDLGTFTTIDLGVAVDLSESYRLGLTVRNLITDKFDVDLGVVNGAALSGTINLDTEARLGLAYHNQFLTVAVDYDLIENEQLLANPVFDGTKTQYFAVGAEFNAFDFAQLRVGARKNVASGIADNAKDTAFTAGVGFWLGFNLDIAATFTSNSVGGFLQTGFRF